MPAHPLDRLDTTERTLQRAQYEAFEFELVEQGVLVRNASHEGLSDHEYLVRIDDGLPDSCTCPADEHHHVRLGSLEDLPDLGEVWG